MSDLPTTPPKWFTGSHEKDCARQIAAGALSGLLAKSAEYPLDTVKVVQQTGSQLSAFEAISQTVETQGVRALYKGLSLPLFGAIVENSCIFYAYDGYKHSIGLEPNQDWSAKSAVAAGLAGIMTAHVLAPLELVKIQIQMKTSSGEKTSSPWRMLKDIHAKQGVAGWYRSYCTTVAREVPGNISWFFTYETLTKLMREKTGHSKEDLPLGYNALAGGFAGVAYWTVPYPFDTLKTMGQSGKFKGMKTLNEMFSYLAKRNGNSMIRGVYAGWGITVARAFPANALIFFVYEGFQRFLEQY